MLRTIDNYFRKFACKHEFEFLTIPLVGTEHHQIYRCKKCGFVQMGKAVSIFDFEERWWGWPQG